VRRVDLAGAAHLQLVKGVVALRPKDAMVGAMLPGWRFQQRARGLQEDTIAPRGAAGAPVPGVHQRVPVELMSVACGRVDGGVDRGTPAGAVDDPRHQSELRLFSEYLCDAGYGWAGECGEAFGTHRCRSDLPRVEHDRAPGRL
jgi:integrase/recombinase XerC